MGLMMWASQINLVIFSFGAFSKPKKVVYLLLFKSFFPFFQVGHEQHDPQGKSEEEIVFFQQWEQEVIGKTLFPLKKIVSELHAFSKNVFKGFKLTTSLFPLL